jgi:hypothetical protein
LVTPAGTRTADHAARSPTTELSRLLTSSLLGPDILPSILFSDTLP